MPRPESTLAALADEQFRYTRYADGSEELYDQSNLCEWGLCEAGRSLKYGVW